MSGKYFTAPPGPCQLSGPDGGQCELYDKCKALELACEQFKRFASFGGEAWRNGKREPNRELFLKIFTAEDVDERDGRTKRAA